MTYHNHTIEYRVDGTPYGFSYQDMKELYIRYSEMSDQDFLSNIVDILHFACIVSYWKGLGLEPTLSDKGIVHELVHLLSDLDYNIKIVREQFKVLELA